MSDQPKRRRSPAQAVLRIHVGVARIRAETHKVSMLIRDADISEADRTRLEEALENVDSAADEAVSIINALRNRTL
jgi:hypothetical protein